LESATVPHDNPGELCREKVAYFRRILSRGRCGKKPTWDLKLALDRAAYAMADAERARTDPTISPTERIGILREERLSLKALELAKERNRPVKAPLSLQQLLAGAR
jgi:hypothetical protein